jgi:ATP-dependent DNA helicase
MDDARRAHAEKRAEAASKSTSTSTSTARAKAKAKAKAKSTQQGRGRGRLAKRRRVADSDSDSNSDADEGEETKPGNEATDAADIDTAAFPQPALVTGGKLKDYQLEGLQWMVGLHQQGISGILGTSSLLILSFKPTYLHIPFPRYASLFLFSRVSLVY